MEVLLFYFPTFTSKIQRVRALNFSIPENDSNSI
jgi:hypothetical protein